MFEKIKSWLRDMWQKRVAEPFAAAKARAAINREEDISEAARALERGQEKLVAYDVARQQPSGTPAEQITPKVAERLRSLQASGSLPQEVAEIGSTLPQPTRSAARVLWDAVKTRLWPTLQRAWNYFDVHFSGRLPIALESMEAERKRARNELGLSVEEYRRKSLLSPQVRQVERRAWQTLVKALRDPEWAVSHYQGEIRQLKDLPLEILLDPMQFIGIVRAPITARARLVGKLRGLGKGAEAAVKVEQYTRRVEEGITRLANTIQKAVADQKAAQDAIEGLKKQVTTAKQFMGQYPELAAAARERLTDAVATASRVPQMVQARIRELRTGLSEVSRELQAAMKEVDEARRAWLVEGLPGAEQRLEQARKRVDELVNLVEQRRNDLLQAIRSLSQEQTKALEAVRSAARSVSGVERRRMATETVLGKLRQAEKQVESAGRVQEAAQRGMRRLASTLEQLRTGGAYSLRVGPVVLPLEPVGKAIGGAYRYVVSHTPGAREAVNLATSVFRPNVVAYSPDISAKEAQEIGRVKRLVSDWLRRSGLEGAVTVRRTLENLTAKNIPQEAWRTGEVVEAVMQGREAAQKLLEKLPAEIRPYVEQITQVWRGSEEDIRRMLEEAFGPEMAGYSGKTAKDVAEGWQFFLENYLPHVVTDPPEKIKEVLPKLTKLLGERAPGSRPSFTQLRRVDTISSLKKLGLHPVEDVRVLEAAHRAQAERLIQLKRMTDFLHAKGFIQPLKEAPTNWRDVGKIFPWLKGYAVHPEFANALEQVRRVFAYDNKVVKTLANLSQKAMNIFRPLVTTMRPIFHINNTMGNIALAMQAGMKPYEIPTYLAKAVKTLASPKTKQERALVDFFQRYGLEGQGIFRDVIEAPTQFVREAERYLEKLAGLKGKIKAIVWPVHRSKMPGLEPLSWMGQVTDSVFRMAAFLNFINKGFTPWEAAQMVKRYFFDYSALSAVERNVLRHVFPFYSWMRYAIPRAVLGPIENPYAWTTFMRVQQRLAEANSVDVGELPYWMQDALVFDVGQDGKVIYLPTQPPQQTLIRFIGAAAESGGRGLQREIASNLSPLITGGALLLTGKDITGGPDPETGWEAVKRVIGKFLPTSAVTGALQLPYSEDRPRTVSPASSGVASLFNPLRMYDKPYAEARQTIKAEQALDQFLADVRKGRTGEAPIEVPETGPIEAEMEKLDKAAMAKAVGEELGKNQWKTALLNAFADGNTQRLWNLINTYPELFYGSNAEVAQRLRQLITSENLIRLAAYLGRKPKPIDIIEHSTQLMRGELPIAGPETRALQKILQQLQTMQRAEQSGGTAQSEATYRPPTGRLTDSDLVNLVNEASRITGVPSNWTPYLLWLAKAENASLDPTAVNPVPVNGEHATGLMQTLPSTFRAYAVSGMTDIYNPLHNMVAAIRYIKSRYGHPSRIPGIGQKPWRGY